VTLAVIGVNSEFPGNPKELNEMKKLFLIAILSFAALSAGAQGYLNFANFASGPGGNVDAPITNATGFGNTVLAMLYVGPPGTTDRLLLTTNGVQGAPAPTFGNGYFTGGQRVITGVNPGQTITAQVRAWIAAAGASYDEARAFDPLMVGESNLIQITLQGPPNSAPNMVGLEGFAIGIPEPSMWALFALGAAFCCATRRRRK
jgi:hypothetical protein